MRRRWIVWLAALPLLLAACADDGEPDAAQEPPPEGDAAQEDDDFVITPTVTTADTDFGEVLVDPDGRALYLFEDDADGESTCYEECAENWPPLITAIAPYSSEEGIAELLGTTTRQEGASQVTYDGWPLYYFAGDSEPGDTSGQGVGGLWWLVDPAGEPIRSVEP